MTAVLAYDNGELVPAESLTIPVFDQGFVQGVTIAEQMRTFGGKLFQLDAHLRRLRRSLEIVGLDVSIDDRLADVLAGDLVSHNYGMLERGNDLCLCLFVTPGAYPTFAASPRLVPAEYLQPRVVAHTYPLPFSQFSELYQNGQPLVITKVRQVPTECWPAELKCRSRMHYYLADLEAAERQVGARALLLDMEGFVAEASTANLFAYFQGEGLVAPPCKDVLPGISLMMVEELAQQLSIPFQRRPLRPEELLTADEVLLCSTSPCVLPVSEIDGNRIGEFQPGRMFTELINAWSDAVGTDVVAQSARFASTP